MEPQRTNTKSYAPQNPEGTLVETSTILLVEDYEPNIVLMGMFFEELGYKCDAAKMALSL